MCDAMSFRAEQRAILEKIAEKYYVDLSESGRVIMTEAMSRA